MGKQEWVQCQCMGYYYYNDVTPLSRLEKENRYSSKVLPTKDLGYLHQLPSIPDLQIDSLPIRNRI